MPKFANDFGAGAAVAVLAVMSWPPIWALQQGMPSDALGWLSVALAIAMILAALFIAFRGSGWSLALGVSVVALLWLVVVAARHPVLLTNGDFELQLIESLVVSIIACWKLSKLRRSET